MSHAAKAPKSASTRLAQLAALLVVYSSVYALNRFDPGYHDKLGLILAIGLLLLGGTLASELLETIGLPHLSAYIIAGLIAGPHVLHLVDHQAVRELAPADTLSVALIALAGGAELRTETLRQVARSLSVATIVQCTLVFVGAATLFMAATRWMPFTRALTFPAVAGTALLWGVTAVSRSPSALLGVLAQTRAKGPLADFSLAFIMTSDVVVVVILAIVMMLARPLIVPGSEFTLASFQLLGHELLGSVACGTTLGLLLAAYLRLVGRHVLLVLLAIGFGLTEFLHYVDVDPLLTFMVAGFIVQNLTRQGPRLLAAVERVSAIVFVVFFANAGAHLDLPLLAKLWPVALALCSGRALLTLAGAKLSSRLARDSDVIKRWGWSSLVSQAGLTLGIAVVITRAFPRIGEGFSSLAVAAVAINEMVGPVLFKMALDRSGESAPAEDGRPSLVT